MSDQHDLTEFYELGVCNYGLISEHHLLQLLPPLLQYWEGSDSFAETVAQTPVAQVPQSITLWKAFIEDVHNAIWDKTPQYCPPLATYDGQHSPATSERSVQNEFLGQVLYCLRPLLKQNEMFLWPTSTVAPGLVGQPTFVMSCQNTIGQLLAIEVKTKWDFSAADMASALEADGKKLQGRSASAFNALTQIFGYIVQNRFCYGILTTYDETWFLYVPPESPRQLLISPAVRCDQTSPTLFQCIFYLINLARSAHIFPTLPALSRPLVASGENQGGEKIRLTRPLDDDENSIPTELLDWEDIQIFDVLGTGQSGVVYRAILHGETVALKICDLWQIPYYRKKILNEVNVYRSLADLQGRRIPRFKAAGYTAGGLFFVATSICGKRLGGDKIQVIINDEEHKEIRRTLRSIHRRSFVHNEIHLQNILIDRDEHQFRVFFIDFASSIGGSKDELRREKIKLKKLLGKSSAGEIKDRRNEQGSNASERMDGDTGVEMYCSCASSLVPYVSRL